MGLPRENPARPLGGPPQPHVLPSSGFLFVEAWRPVPVQGTPGRFLRGATHRTEALLKAGLAHGAETRGGLAALLPAAWWGWAGLALLEGPHHITSATCCDFRPSGCRAVPRMFGRRTGDWLPGVPPSPSALGLPFSHQTRRPEPTTESNQPQCLVDARPPGSRGEKERVPEARGRRALPADGLWDNAPFSSHGPVSGQPRLL